MRGTAALPQHRVLPCDGAAFERVRETFG